MTDIPTQVDRRLFVGGERLRVSVQAPPSGGGPKYEPQTAEQAQQLLRPMVTNVRESALALPAALRGDRIYVEARLLPNFLAASYFPGALLNQIGAVAVGSRADSGLYRTRERAEEATTRRLVLAIDDDGIEALEALVARPGASRSERQAFAEIRKLDRISIAAVDEIVISRPDADAEPVMWEAVLHPRSAFGGEAEALDPTTMERWYTYVERLGGRNHRDFTRRVGGLTFAPIELSPDAVDELARFNPLRALRPMPTIRPRPRFGVRAGARLTPPADTTPRNVGPIVAVFDGGLRVGPGGSPFFPNPHVDLTTEPADDDDLDHGTGVSGAATYGLARPGSVAGQPDFPVQNFRVLPAPNVPGDLEGYAVLDEIVATVASGAVDIVNLSLGPELAVEDTLEPNRWTSELDQLAWERDVLFVVAAGNGGDQDQATGLHRVQVPADMVNGVSVGACNAENPLSPWRRAEYSSMGPGRHGNRIQPTVVQFGGSTNDFPVLRADGSFLDADGTSFAAPLVTHALAELATRLPRPSPAVLRAFAAHFAERHRTHRRLINDVGFGRSPLEYSTLLESTPDDVTVLFVDQIERGDLVGYQVPIPAGLNVPLELRVTLAYLTPVDPTQPTEYTRASIDLTLRPHHHIHSFRPPAGSSMRSTKADITSAEGRRLVEEGWEFSQEPVSKNLGAPPNASEARLRDAGKWETVRHHRLALGPGEVEAPRLELSYVARRSGALDGGEATGVPFALLVSVRDTSSAGTLHDATAAAFPRLTVLPPVRTRVRTRRRA